MPRCGAGTLVVVASEGVYRTADGLVFRVSETVEGGLKVEVLKDGVWTPGRIGIVGLRLDRSTTKLTPNAVEPGAFQEHLEGLRRGSTQPSSAESTTQPTPAAADD